jgi:hypothetical protein
MTEADRILNRIRKPYHGTATELENAVFEMTGCHVIAIRDPQSPGSVRLYSRQDNLSEQVLDAAKVATPLGVSIVPTDPDKLLREFIAMGHDCLRAIGMARWHRNRFRLLLAFDIVFLIGLVAVLNEIIG